MEIVSTMGSGSLGRELDLEVLVAEIQNHLGREVDTNFTSSGMVTIRLNPEGPAYTIYRTGSFQLRGAKTEEALEQALARFRQILIEIDVEIPNFEFTHATSVFMGDLGHKVGLEELAVTLGLEHTEYEPEQFPGLVYRPDEFEVTLLVFASGKVIICGTPSKGHAEGAFEQFRSRVSATPR